MGQGQSNTSQRSATPADKNARTATIRKAVESGNQFILQKDVVQKATEVSDLIKKYSEDDYQGILTFIDKYNENITNAGVKITIPESVTKSLATFHSKILESLNTAGKSEAQKYDQFKNVMTKSSSDVMNLLKKTYTAELEEKKDTLLSSEGIADNKMITKNLDETIDSITTLKVRYKYFEYKYIEMNLFLLLFIQHSYQTMDDFVHNVMDFNMMRDKNREEILKQTLSIMTNIVDNSSLELDTAQIDGINNLMGQLRDNMKQKDDKMQKEMQRLLELTSKDMSTFIGSLSEAMQNNLRDTLADPNRPPSQPAPASATMPQYPPAGAYPPPSSAYPPVGPAVHGGFIRDGSVMPQENWQKGGFIRDGSVMPQSFHDLSKAS